jgi:hypothetical protein
MRITPLSVGFSKSRREKDSLIVDEELWERKKAQA